jgi:hypothetical protein
MFVNPRFFEPVAIPCGSLIRGHDYTVVPVPVKAGNPALPAGRVICIERSQSMSKTRLWRAVPVSRRAQILTSHRRKGLTAGLARDDAEQSQD